MAQKTRGQETTPTGFGKPYQAAPSVEGVMAAEIVINAPQAEKSLPSTQSARQEYPEVNAAIDKGLADVAAGRVYRMSFAEYAETSVED